MKRRTRRVTSKPERRNQTRRAISAQLVEGQDDDLINAILTLPAGERQQTIKALLRKALNAQEPRKSSAADYDALRAEIDALRGALAALESHSEADPRTADLRAEINAIHAGIAQRDRTIEELTVWAQGTHDRLQEIYAGGYVSVAQVVPEPEDQPGDLLSQEKARERAARMKRNQW